SLAGHRSGTQFVSEFETLASSRKLAPALAGSAGQIRRGDQPGTARGAEGFLPPSRHQSQSVASFVSRLDLRKGKSPPWRPGSFDWKRGVDGRQAARR